MLCENRTLKRQEAGQGSLGHTRSARRCMWMSMGGSTSACPVVLPAMSLWCCTSRAYSPRPLKIWAEGEDAARKQKWPLSLPWQRWRLLTGTCVASKGGGFFPSWGLWAKDTSRLQLYICQFDQQMGERAIKLWRLSPSPFNPARRAGVISPLGALIGF